MHARVFLGAIRLRSRNTLSPMDQWWEYVTRIAGTDEQKTIAANAGIGPTVINRWANGSNEPSAKLVVTFARAYRRPPVEALVAASILDESDASAVIEIQRDLSNLDDDELVEEVRRRMSRPTSAVTRPEWGKAPKPPSSGATERIAASMRRPGDRPPKP